MQTLPTVLVAEDDKTLNRFIRMSLKREGFNSVAAGDGETTLRLSRETPYDVIILDVMMPKMNGFQALQELRQAGHSAAILMLTHQSNEFDRLAGLNGGADDFITKPFLMAELIARIRAVLRRRPATSYRPNATVLEHNDIQVDRLRQVVHVKGRPVHLTKKQFELLVYFMRHPRQALTRSTLESSVWNMEFACESNVVEVQMNHLRTKIHPRCGSRIVTVRGIGYRFEP